MLSRPEAKFNTSILMLSTSFPAYDKHFAGSFIYELGCNLVQDHGVQLEVLTPDTNYDSDRESVRLPRGFSLTRFRYFWPRKLQKLAAINSGGMPHLLRTSLLAWLNLPLLIVAFLFHIAVRANRSKVIHAHWGPLAAIALCLKPIHRKPIVLTLHGSDFKSSIPFIQTITQFGIKYSEAVIVLSREFLTIAQGLRNSTENVFYIPNGVSAPPSEQVASIRGQKIERTLQIVTVGRLIPERNHDVLINGIEKLIRKGRDVSLTIVGTGPAEHLLKSLAASKDLNSFVHFTGELPTDEVSKVLLTSDLYVSPTSVDNYGTAVVEASLHGLAVITTPIGFPGELVKDKETGLHIAPRDEEDLINAVESFLDHPAQIQNFGSAMLKRATDLGLQWSACAKRTADLYRTLLNKPL